jgi:pimeloyl-ACP methyl ester carboxylesterase
MDRAAAAALAGTSSGRSKANVVLVHGAWVDGSLWNRVIPILQRQGHNVVAVQLPLTSLAEDVAWTRHVLAERLQGPTVLAGQSYGGAVISGAATGIDNVISLVFAAAFAPDEGETLVQLNGGFTPRLAWPTCSLTRWAFCGSIRRRSRTTSLRTFRYGTRRSWPRCKSPSLHGAPSTRRGRQRGGRCRRGTWSPPRTG